MLIFRRFKNYDEERRYLLKEITEFLNIDIEDLEIYHVYDFENTEFEEEIKKEIFDFRYGQLVQLPENVLFVKDNDGQYNQVEDLTKKFVNNVLGLDTDLRYLKAYDFNLKNPEDISKIKEYLINPVVQKEVELEDLHFSYEISDDTEMREVENFINYSDDELLKYKDGFGLDFDDLKFIQEYFKKEGRNPRYCELKMLDTYWSDHCRHTTFLTNIEDVQIKDGKYKEIIEKSYDSYLKTREEVYTEKVKPMTLMDLATINMRELKKNGILSDMEVSDEVNACSIEVDIEVDGKSEKWLHMFKNETHNHPTEIEPYGGAHTCIGGGIRDPLSGRAQVIQGIRLVGAGNPLTKYEDTVDGKLSQRYLAHMAMNGFSDYANQIGSAVGLVKEFYDDGFQAKRMELGALTAAVPKENVLRENSEKGDLILLLGAPTGRDGLGAAVGSSSMQTEKSLTKAGAEVQKGNPFEERKIIKLFNRKDATKLIKKSNDFGAGGVSVAVGELADGLDIYLDEVYTKYPGLNGYEIALSESQERMAVVIDESNLEEFTKYCDEEDLRYAIVAKVNDENRLRMYHNDKLVIDLSRELLDSNGASKYMNVVVNTNPNEVKENEEITRLNQAISTSLTSGFDSTLGRNKVFMEYGGKNQSTAQLATVVKFPHEKTNAVSVMAYGYFPQIAKESTYHAGYYAALQSIVNNLAITGEYKNIRLTMQEFFPSINGNPERFGLPFQALLGAYEVMKTLDIPAIGGKDSMSGTFKDIDVPPTLVSFAVNVSKVEDVVSRELKSSGLKLLLTKVAVDELGMVDLESFGKVMDIYGKLVKEHKVLSASSILEYGLNYTLKDMAIGNGIKFELNKEINDQFLPGNIIFEVENDTQVDESLFEEIGRTTGYIDTLKTERTEDSEKVFENILEENKAFEIEEVQVELPKVNPKNKKALVPVIEGVVGEYDLINALVNAGFEVEEYIVKTSSKEKYENSIKELASKIQEVSLFAIPHGDYLASVIKNISGLMRKILLEDEVKEALKDLVSKDGFILGIGAGMASLIDAKYFGDLEDTLRFRTNKNNRYISMMMDVKVVRNSYVSDESYEYSAPVSGRMMTIECLDKDKLVAEVDILSVNKSNNIPNDCGIDGIQSKCGHIIGVRTLIERMSEDLYKNIRVSGQPRHFTVLGEYFN
ncbi:MAG: phosphoribosylformylglycinamidine synthase [Tissierellia bacterium]|nr:phosphoribosylformylglycinamidine synthase [Tissierellia bacterium]